MCRIFEELADKRVEETHSKETLRYGINIQSRETNVEVKNQQ